MNNWAILGIAATEDREAIKRAYMSQLSKHNPEDDPEGFARLRTAYEQALKDLDERAKAEAADTTPHGQFMTRVERVYNEFAQRCDPNLWRELLTDEACVRLDLVDATEEQLLGFFMNNFYLPQEVWALLAAHFDWQSRGDVLKQNFPGNFIDYLLYSAKQENLKYALFTSDGAAEAHQYDRWIWLYYEIEVLINARTVDGNPFLELKVEIEALPIRHVYYDLQLARLHMTNESPQEALAITEPLFAQMPEDTLTRYLHGMALWANGQNQEAHALFQSTLEKDPDDLNAKKGLIDAKIALEDYESARELLLEILNKFPYDLYALPTFRTVTDALVQTYEKKHGADPKDLDTAITLAKHYLNAHQYDQAQAVLERLSPIPEDARYYEYLAACYQVAGVGEKAIAMYERNIAMEPRLRNYSIFADALISMNKLDQALSCIEKGLALEDDERLYKAYLYSSRGYTLSLQEKFEDALVALDQGIAINNQLAHLYLHKARTYHLMNRYSEALDAADQSMTIFPYQSEPYTIQMEIYNSAGMYEQMLAVSDRADQMG
ncbi:MAG: tetratricopeptide repeat protein, partial [Oscillospiraceae bacterium]|nr:tetratricopeptide repeat protein [Oscillospiraceae bacterium]